MKKLIIACLLYLLLILFGLWKQRLSPEQKAEYSTSINPTMATALYRWNVNTKTP